MQDQQLEGVSYRLDEKFAEALLDLLCLGAIKTNAEGLYRVASKGVRIFGEADLTPIPFSLNVGISSYEERRDSYESITGRAGLWLDPHGVAPMHEVLCRYWGARIRNPKQTDLLSSSLVRPLPLVLFTSFRTRRQISLMTLY